MEQIKKLLVSIRLANEEVSLGELVSESKGIYFKYFPSFIERGIQISPFKLKLGAEIRQADALPFDGLFGVFADSMPDGWGRLLLDRALAEKGIRNANLSLLNRLAFVGSKGMGALTYRPEMEIEHLLRFEFELDAIASSSKQVLEGLESKVIDKLFALGGSSGGARPKILVAFNNITKEIIGSDQILPIGFEHWLIKFPSSNDSIDIANIEFSYYKMALDAGIEMSECRLFTGESNKQYFGTKRFDRVGKSCIHMHSAAGIMHDNFRQSNLDYGNLMDCAFKLENDVIAYEKILRLAAFNVFAHNRDDHSKNFSFLMNSDGIWRAAPAYDLTFSSSSHGMHSTMIAGESANPTKKNLIDLGRYFKVNNSKKIIDQVYNVVQNWRFYAEKSGVGKQSIKRIESVIVK
ncbi:MAG: type II toxin-antitoxin system HipA family toxin [bacterium]|nr:type II toxin-antitoxin system HipA family toxin [bacterium]